MFSLEGFFRGRESYKEGSLSQNKLYVKLKRDLIGERAGNQKKNRGLVKEALRKRKEKRRDRKLLKRLQGREEGEGASKASGKHVESGRDRR